MKPRRIAGLENIVPGPAVLRSLQLYETDRVGVEAKGADHDEEKEEEEELGGAGAGAGAGKEKVKVKEKESENEAGRMKDGRILVRDRLM